MILSPHIDRPEVSTRLLELSTALRSFADQNARAYVMVNKEKALVGAFYGYCESSRRFVDDHNSAWSRLTRGGVGDEGEVVGALVVVADLLVAGVDQLLHHRQRHPVPSVRAEGDRALAQDCN